jgi:glutathione S-transferase
VGYAGDCRVSGGKISLAADLAARVEGPGVRPVDQRRNAFRLHRATHCHAHELPRLLSRQGDKRRSLADITRITALWEESRERFGSGGEFLLGRFSAADAFYAPVASRFITYAVPLKPVAQAYVAAISALPTMREWVAAGKAESEVLNVDEPYR